MMEHISKIINKEKIGKRIYKFILEKPSNFTFNSGQAIELSINSKDKTETSPFTICSTNSDNFLEFIIKIYSENNRLTKDLQTLSEGDELIISEPFGNLKFIRPGVFIAGGTGINPFLSIFRDLKSSDSLNKNLLLYSAKNSEELIAKEEIKSYLGDKANFFLTEEKNKDYSTGRINKETLNFFHLNNYKNFYICGPLQFVIQMKKYLDEMNIPSENILIEI